MEFWTGYIIFVFAGIPLLINGGGGMLGLDTYTLHSITVDVVAFFAIVPILNAVIKFAQPPAVAVAKPVGVAVTEEKGKKGKSADKKQKTNKKR